MKGRRVWLYTDSEVAYHVLSKGWSPVEKLAIIAAQFWLRCMQLQLCIWFDVVKSEANIADGPSRGYYGLLGNATKLEAPAMPSLLGASACFGLQGDVDTQTL